MKTAKGYRKQIQHYDIPGQAHYLTFTCFRNQAFLSKDRTRHWFIESLEKARSKHDFDLWGWVIMPEHVHLMILPKTESSISKILASIKIPVSRLACSWLKKNSPNSLSQITDKQPSGNYIYRFWQRGGGYDRNISSVQELYEKLNYMHKNPVRRGLVEHPGDWHWSSFRAYENNVEDPIGIDRESLPPLR